MRTYSNIIHRKKSLIFPSSSFLSSCTTTSSLLAALLVCSILWPICYETDSLTAEAVGAPSIEIHEVEAHGTEMVHVTGFKLLDGTEAVGEISACSEITATVCLAAEEYALTH